MKQPTPHRLNIKWTTSRGRDTYGYNICTLTDDRGAQFRTIGGGYDMTSTVLGDWMAAQYQERLHRIRRQAYTSVNKRHKCRHNESPTALYGCSYNAITDKVTLDGGCGENSMRAIAKAIGLDVMTTYNNRKGHHDGFIVSDRRAPK